jgi:15-cis-phytoene synthase
MNETSESEVIRRHSKSFALAAKLLSPIVRRRAERLYAWCRAADDAIDLAPSPLDAVVALENVRSDLDAIYSGLVPQAPAAKWLADVVHEIRLPREYPEALLDGMAMDLSIHRYESFDDLLMYCHRAAGVVGLMMCHALGVADESAALHACHLGMAMQMTNIARDVAEDWRRGRLYLPLAWLPHEPPRDCELNDELVSPAIRRLLDEADRYYDSGRLGLRALDRRSRLAIRVAADVYQAIGDDVRRRDCRPSLGRAYTSRGEKWRTVVGAAWRTLWERPTVRTKSPSLIWNFQPL